ncbi:MAG: DUF4846 domain-containing protein [Microscillaceae bacterium]|nr:DUF4846 domain-containing protein [Microscillaceae bacterium]
MEYPLLAQVHSNPEKSVLRTFDWRFSLPSSISDIPLPAGFERQYTSVGSYASYLQNLCLRSDTIIYLHNGQKKPNQSFGFMVVDLDVGEKNLQQCADAVIRLRSEYLFATKQFGGIHFNFSSGHTAYYTQWRQGYRAKITQKEVHWVKEADFDDSYQSFREYLDLVFNYAGSWSLERELSTISDIQDMQIGDVLIRGAFPGHVMLVVDMARHTESGEILFLLAQSARPAQDFHIVKNRSDLFLNPWYSLDALNTQLEIEEWTFYKDSLKRF